MSQDYAAVYVRCISSDDIRKIVPDEYDLFAMAVKKFGMDDLSSLAVLMRDITVADDDSWVSELTSYRESYREGNHLSDDDTSIMTAIADAYRNLVAAFYKATIVDNLGLYIDLRYHDSEADGSKYDDVDGAYWSVDGAEQLTAAGQKFSSILERCLYVVFC